MDKENRKEPGEWSDSTLGEESFFAAPQGNVLQIFAAFEEKVVAFQASGFFTKERNIFLTIFPFI